jgi:hypothetical protein
VGVHAPRFAQGRPLAAIRRATSGRAGRRRVLEKGHESSDRSEELAHHGDRREEPVRAQAIAGYKQQAQKKGRESSEKRQFGGLHDDRTEAKSQTSDHTRAAARDEGPHGLTGESKPAVLCAAVIAATARSIPAALRGARGRSSRRRAHGEHGEVRGERRRHTGGAARSWRVCSNSSPSSASWEGVIGTMATGASIVQRHRDQGANNILVHVTNHRQNMRFHARGTGLRIPTPPDHRFRTESATDSERSRPLIPGRSAGCPVARAIIQECSSASRVRSLREPQERPGPGLRAPGTRSAATGEGCLRRGSLLGVAGGPEQVADRLRNRWPTRPEYAGSKRRPRPWGVLLTL